MKSFKRILIISVLSVLPGLQWACSVCGGVLAEEKADAYIWITGLLASMPVLMFGILGTWIYYRYKDSVATER